jgi:hypothetical protein
MSTKPTQRGGRREGAGRPPKPVDERRDQLFAVKLTAAEKQLLDATEAGKWARETLLKTAKRKAGK